MPTIKLTDLAVKRLKLPAEGQTDYFDATLPGFGVRVSEKGRKSFVLMYRGPNKRGKRVLRRLTLGAYPALTLAEARALAREALQEVERGGDPIRQRQERRRTGDSPRTVTAVADQFIQRHAKEKNRRWGETKRIFDREVLPAWGDRPIGSITRIDVIELLDPIMDRGAPYMANRVLAAVRKLFNWAI